MRNETIVHSWEHNADAWTRAVRSRALESRRLATDAAINAAVLRRDGVRVLDVGCGEGWLARQLAAAGRDVTGFDATPRLIERARDSGGGTFLVLSYEEFAREPARAGHDFDVAVCNFSLIDEDVAGLLRGLHRVCRADAHLIIQTVHPLTALGDAPYADGWREEKFDDVAGDDWTPMPWYFRTIASWIGALRTAEWQLVDCIEPLHPVSGMPASLILDAVPAPV